MFNETGHKIFEAGPATPVEVLGLQGTPSAGDDFIVVKDETQAKEVTGYRIRKERDAKLVKSAKSAMEQMLDKIKSGESKHLPVIIKADVQGSIEAIEGTIKNSPTMRSASKSCTLPSDRFLNLISPWRKLPMLWLSALTSVPFLRRAMPPGAMELTFATIPSSTMLQTTSRKAWKACSLPNSKKRFWDMPKSARSITSPASAKLPAA